MNRIFKKVWNRRRGCFVAVSEAMTSASQRAGKAACIVGVCLLSANSFALSTINGDATYDDLPLRGSSTTQYNYISDDVHVLGNFVYSSSTITPTLYVGNTSGSVGIPSITVTIDKNFTVETNRSWVIAHNHNRGQNVYGSTVVNGDAYNYGLIEVGTRNTSHDGNITANLTVGGTLFNYGVTRNNSDNSHGQANLTGTLSIGTLNNNGTFQMLGGSVSGTFGNVIQTSGVFQQVDSNDFYISNLLSLNGGSLVLSTPIVVGERTGNFSIGNSLTLGGGSLNQTSLLTQKAGSVSVTAGNYSFDTFNKTNGTLSNAGTLAITNLNQTAGSTGNSGTLTIGNANLYGSLNNTGTLTLTGNVTSRGNLSSSGTLNNQGTWTEANAFNVSGTLNNTGSVNFQNGFGFASNGKLNSSGTVKTSNASNIFDSLGSRTSQELKYISLGATTPQAVKTSLNNFFKKYLPGTVSQTLAQHASFTGGKVIVSGVNLTTTQRDDLTKAFKAQFFLLFSDVSTSTVSEQC